MQQWKRSCRLCILKDLVSLDTFQHFPVKHGYPLTVRFPPVTKSPPWNAALGSTTPLLLATKGLWWPLGSGCVPVLHWYCHLAPGWAFVDLLSVVQPRPSLFTAQCLFREQHQAKEGRSDNASDYRNWSWGTLKTLTCLEMASCRAR